MHKSMTLNAYVKIGKQKLRSNLLQVQCLANTSFTNLLFVWYNLCKLYGPRIEVIF